MSRKKLLTPDEAKAIDDFNLEMNTEIGDVINSIEKTKNNGYISMNPIVSKDPNELKLEIGTETGIPDDDEM